MSTVRDYLEGIADRELRFGVLGRHSDNYRDAKAALALLDGSKKTFGKFEGRLVLDHATITPAEGGHP